VVECLLRDLFLECLISDFRLFGPEAFGGSTRTIGSAELEGWLRLGGGGGDPWGDGGGGSITVGVLDW